MRRLLCAAVSQLVLVRYDEASSVDSLMQKSEGFFLAFVSPAVEIAAVLVARGSKLVPRYYEIYLAVLTFQHE